LKTLWLTAVVLVASSVLAGTQALSTLFSMRAEIGAPGAGLHRLELSAEVIGASGGLGRKQLRSRIEHIYKTLLDCDFGYQNTGGIRAIIEPGEISIRDVWTVLPFDNTLVKLTLPGDKLHPYARKQLGTRFDPQAEYTIATNSYVSDQQEKYFRVTDAKVEDTGRLMRDEVVNWVRKNAGFAPKSGKDDAGAKKTGNAPDRGLEPGEKR
jgi:hypothetical protein